MIALGVVAGVWLLGRRLEQKGIGTREDANSISVWARNHMSMRLSFSISSRCSKRPWKLKNTPIRNAESAATRPA